MVWTRKILSDNIFFFFIKCGSITKKKSLVNEGNPVEEDWKKNKCRAPKCFHGIHLEEAFMLKLYRLRIPTDILNPVYHILRDI